MGVHMGVKYMKPQFLMSSTSFVLQTNPILAIVVVFVIVRESVSWQTDALLQLVLFQF